MRDPTWSDPTPTTAQLELLPGETTPVVLPGPPTQTEPPEDVTAVMKTTQPQEMMGLRAVIDLPPPVTATAAGFDAQESWVFERRIAGSPYGLHVRVSRQPVDNLQQLRAMATEMGSKDVTTEREEPGRLWLERPVEGPLTEIWTVVQMPVRTLQVGLRTRKKAPPVPAGVLAVCATPPQWVEAARAACRSLRSQ